MYRLHGVYESQILSYKIDQATTPIGRDPQGKVVVDHPAVSKHHALIELIDGTPFITDLDSNNGTFVNDDPIKSNERFLLQPGDEIRIGDRRFTLYSEDTPKDDPTKALSDNAKHPSGPTKAFPPDPAQVPLLSDTVRVDADSLRKETLQKERDEAQGPSLAVRGGKMYDRPVRITHPEFLIGRGRASHLRLTDNTASKVHCRLIQRKDRYFLYDDNSLNGTFVSGERIRGTALCDGDLILVGTTVIRFNDPQSPKTTADPGEVERAFAQILQQEKPVSSSHVSGKVIGVLVGGAVVLAGIVFLVLRLAGVV